MQVRIAALALGLLGLVELVVAWRLEPPKVLPIDAPSDQFSAARTEATLGRILGAELPHPSGTAEQAAVRERLLAELEALHLTPELQHAHSCDARLGVCAEVVNVVARVPGKSERSRLGLVAHYSVPAGPGAGDDGQGTATLIEVARALGAKPADESVALIFTDGEELGLLGARAFVREHPLMQELETVINVEARGNRGPSLMFETTPGSAWLVDLYARAAEHPVTSSLFPAVYRALPNDTDFTIFAERGLQGLNFAFVGGVENYHTPRDRMQHLDFRSVQQQGTTVLGLAREITAHGQQAPTSDSIFFDVLALGVVRMRLPWFWGLAVVSTATLLLFVLRTFQRNADYARALPRAFGAVALGLVLPCLAAWLLALGLGWLGALPFVFVATPGPLLGALVVWASSGHAWAQSRARTVSARLALWDATWLLWLLLGWLLLALAPGVSYLCWVPAWAAAALRPFGAERDFASGHGGERRDSGVAPRALPRFALVVLTALLIWLPPASIAYSALGFALPPVLAFMFSMALGPVAFVLAPLLTSSRRWIALAVLGLLVGLAQCLLAPTTASVPQRLPLALSVDGDGRAEWLADIAFGPLPASLASAAAWRAPTSDPHPWPGFGTRRVQRAVADVAPRATTLQPIWRVVAKGRHEIELELPLGAWAATVHLRGLLVLASASFRGQAVRARVDGAWQAVTLVPGSDRRVVLSLELSDDTLPEIEVSALTRGLPPEAAPLIAARGDAAISSQLGDVTLDRVRLAAPALE